MADIWLVRHTETDWNEQRRYQSHSDRPLTPAGVARLRTVVEFLREASIDLVVSTGLARTDVLAAAIAGRHEGARRAEDRRLREIDHGRWEGLTYDDVKARFGEKVDERFRDPWRSRVHEGETLAEVTDRVRAAWRELSRTREGVCVVAHATPLQVLLCGFLGMPMDRHWRVRLDLGGISRVRVEPGGARVRFLNHVPSGGREATATLRT